MLQELLQSFLLVLIKLCNQVIINFVQYLLVIDVKVLQLFVVDLFVFEMDELCELEEKVHSK